MKIGDLVQTDNDVGVITKLPYELVMDIEDRPTKLICFEVLWSGADHSTRVSYTAYEDGTIRITK